MQLSRVVIYLTIPFASRQERCPPRQKSRVERLKAKVEPFFTLVTVDNVRAWSEMVFQRRLENITAANPSFRSCR